MNIFIGDSHVAGWDLHKYFPGRSTGNYGVAGEKISQIQKRLAAFSLPEGNCFIIAGTNDFTAKSWKAQEEFTSEMINDFIKTIQTASTSFKNIYVISLFPIGEKFSCQSCISSNSAVFAINDSLKSIISRNFPKVTFVDITSHLTGTNSFLKSDYTHDGLHLSERGYEILSTEVRAYVE
jgi:lysophospholipase L1-like esterase